MNTTVEGNGGERVITTTLYALRTVSGARSLGYFTVSYLKAGALLPVFCRRRQPGEGDVRGSCSAGGDAGTAWTVPQFELLRSCHFIDLRILKRVKTEEVSHLFSCLHSYLRTVNISRCRLNPYQ